MARTETRSSGIVIDKNNVALMHRIKDGYEYWVFPGGGIEENETIEDALSREMVEELDIEVKQKRFLFKIENASRSEYYFLITEYEGQPRIGGPELERMNKENQYILIWFPVEQLNSINLFPGKAKEMVSKLL